MAGSTRIEMNSEGARQLLTSPDIRADLLRRGQAVARSAGPGFEAIPQTRRTARAAVVVVPTTASARRAQARDRVLNRAIDAARS